MRWSLKYRSWHILWLDELLSFPRCGYCFNFMSPRLRGPAIRTGLWVTQKVSGNRAEFDAFTSSIRANHQLAGVCLHVPWNQVEKERGKLDFTAVDNFVAALRDIGMKYQLCFKPGASTPAFVYAEGAQAFETRVMNPHRANFGEAIVIPVPWDPIYQRNFPGSSHNSGNATPTIPCV